MKILAVLPADRTRPGWLRLLEGTLLAFTARCLGKADNGRALARGNPTRDPVLPYGDTPSGIYSPAKAIAFDPPHPRMGRHAIPLIGVSGPALTAMTLRDQLYIHGGRGDDRLIPTFGCLRLLDRDMAALVGELRGMRADIEIADLLTEV